jgi:curved DNA-binding protein CbpA
MKLDSKLFDGIRIRPTAAAGKKTTAAAAGPVCSWAGCDQPGTHKAPKGRNREGQYHQFCIEHVKQYNKNYNYFSGMGDDAVAAYQKDSLTGHRPTWTMGVNSAGEQRERVKASAASDWTGGIRDPFDMFGGGYGPQAPEPEKPKRHLKALEKKSFETLELEGSETSNDIKARYKSLVKMYHPDANGGDRGWEDKLREIITAYNYLKAAGFC